MSRIPQLSTFLTTLIASALASPTALHARNELITITLDEPLLITEVVPYFIKTESAVDKAGDFTLGLGCLDLLGVGCLAEITHVDAPTTVTLTGVGITTTVYPGLLPTTYTSSTYDSGCGCYSSTVYQWTPPPYPTYPGYPSHPICGPSHPTTSVTVTTTTTVPTTVTVTTTATASASCAPTLTCDEFGYLIQDVTLFRVDLSTGSYIEIADNLGDGSGINAMAYNTLDNFLYAHQGGANEVIRISSDGAVEVISTLDTSGSFNVGDIDSEGNYWLSSGGSNWNQVDMNPSSPSFGSSIANGTMDTLGLSFADWAYIPIAGPYLYSVGRNPRSIGGSSLARFSLQTKQWDLIQRYPNMFGNTFGAMYGINNGTLYASDNTNGEIWGFPVVGGGRPYLASQGPVSGLNDGARCVLNLLADLSKMRS